MLGLEQFMIGDDGLENVMENGGVTGFRVGLSIPYYRALPLSCIEEIALQVDGQAVGGEDLRFELDGERFGLDELSPLYDRWWSVDKRAYLVGRKPGGLQPGEHAVMISMKLRCEALATPRMDPEEKPMYDRSLAVKSLILT
ncbi:MAG: hypothetical protein C4536_12245 [Actinobacteria bacterium]|jgi:hypothetical protein|nr:MAG: hypothetical protein C4536_12245 [Actinomycetota bacterium]